MKKEIKETIKSHFDQSPIKNRIIKGGKIESYSDLSRFLALKSLEKSFEKMLCFNSLENKYKESKLAEKIINNIESIELCGQCGKAIIAIIGGIDWWKKGTFQCGERSGRILSWCSRKCYKKYFKNIKEKSRH